MEKSPSDPLPECKWTGCSSSPSISFITRSHKLQASLRTSFSCSVRVPASLIRESEGSCSFKWECTLGEGHLLQSSTWPSPEPFPQAADRVANAVQEQLYGSLSALNWRQECVSNSLPVVAMNWGRLSRWEVTLPFSPRKSGTKREEE